MTVERIAGLVESDVVWQLDRQVRLRHCHDTAIIAMDDRDRAAPITLAGNTPVAQTEVDLTLALRCIAERSGRQPIGDDIEGFLRGLAVEEA